MPRQRSGGVVLCAFLLCGGLALSDAVTADLTSTSLGCYWDNVLKRDMDDESARRGTLELCMDFCFRVGPYPYFGMQVGKECRCANSYGRYGTAPAAACSMTCRHNSSQTCGGWSVNSVYRVEWRGRPLPTLVNTDAPATQKRTRAPPTRSPGTAAPPTRQPRTYAPPTRSPQTRAPRTDAPRTDAPKTRLSRTQSPETAVPPTQRRPPQTDVPLTRSPQTRAPHTDAPRTDVPQTRTQSPDVATVVPPTQTRPPQTDAPPTRPPQTDAPRTHAPTAAPVATPAPPSAATTPAPEQTPTHAPTVAPTPTGAPPATDSPEAAAPITGQTSVPPAPSETPQPLQEQDVVPAEEIQKRSAVAAIGSSLASGFSVGTAMRLSLVSSGCSHKVPRVFHPTGLVIGGSEEVGTIIGNVSIALGLALFGLLMRRLSRSCAAVRLLIDGLDMQGLWRIPSAPLMLLHFFYQGTTLAAMTLVFEPAHQWHVCLGITVLLVSVGVPCMIIHVVPRDVPLMAVYAQARQRQGKPISFILGSGDWVNLHRGRQWVQSYVSVCKTYRQTCAVFVVIEFAASFALSAIQSTAPENATGCGHMRVASALVFLGMLVLEVTLLPHARHRDNFADILMLGLQMVAMVYMAVGYYSGPSEWTFDIAGHLLNAAVYILLLRVLCDLVTELYLILSGRRAALQEHVFRQFEDPVTNCDLEVEVEVEVLEPAATESPTWSVIGTPYALTLTGLLVSPVSFNGELDVPPALLSSARPPSQAHLLGGPDSGISLLR